MADKFFHDDIRETIQKSETTGTNLILENYFSSSSGGHSDLEVQLLPAGGYDDLVKRSHEMVTTNKESMVEKLQRDFPDADPDLVATCVNEQIASWETRMKLVQDGHGEVEKGPLTKEGAYWVKSSDPFLTVLRGVLMIKTTPRSSTKDKKAKVRKVGKTVIKEALRSMTPLHNYVGMLNLSVDSVDDVRLAAE